ncbi:hypothetical protein FE257_012423 [Aspergillus nanangensis]|uniref:Zinc finger PHD-type domain-containing protein n=1 Tax=Aspergillus nanangensis TaxID=2582783 RepID=A0AAD4CWI6_ASPNN|nr:hypothetical protein FE257_012423 [Aspergillus nanangensis]
MAPDPNADAQTSELNGTTPNANPYETNPNHIPKDDPFLKLSPQYGRYARQDDEFKPRYDQWWAAETDSTAYWEEIVKSSWTPENSLNVPDGREAFVTGNVIIRVERDGAAAGEAADKYSNVNANELSAARKAEKALKELGIAVPIIHFCGTIEGKNVTVESRIPGVSLEVAWRYLTSDQINSFKEQCRGILEPIAGTDTAPEKASYVCDGLNSQSLRDVGDLERDILFQEKQEGERLALVHNNLTPSNIIVNDDRVVGISGWRHSGYFGFERAKKIHQQHRPLAQSLSDETNGAIEGAPTWADLYDNFPAPHVKTEPLSMTLDRVPLDEETGSRTPLSQVDGADDLPTQKHIANLKHGRGSRASSSDRSSPANSIKPGSSGRKSTPAGAKKAPAKKTAGKKRKINDEDNESVDGRRSNTPSSRASKTPGMKKQGSASGAPSPAPETKKKGGKRGGKKAAAAAATEEESSDENAIFCICRKPDNHTWMIGCDGECEDWFHGKCVKIDPRDADLIEKYICE